jgi:hypothetical protein
VAWSTESLIVQDVRISEWDWGCVVGTWSGFIGRVQKMRLRVSALEVQDNQEHTTSTNAYIGHNQLIRDYIRTERE